MGWFSPKKRNELKSASNNVEQIKKPNKKDLPFFDANDGKAYSCSYCGKGYESLAETKQCCLEKRHANKEYACKECGEVYSSQKDADECCADTSNSEEESTNDEPINYKDYLIEKGAIAIFDLESFSDTYSGDNILLEVAKAFDAICNKGYTLKLNIDCQNNGNQGEIVFEKKELK